MFFTENFLINYWEETDGWPTLIENKKIGYITAYSALNNTVQLIFDFVE